MPQFFQPYRSNLVNQLGTFNPPPQIQVDRNVIPDTLDRLFNQYLAMKQGQRQEAESIGQQQLRQQQLQLGQQQLAAGQGAAALQGIQQTAQFGAPLTSYSPQQITQAGQGIQPQGPGLPPDQARLQRLVEGMNALRTQQGQAGRLGEANIQETEATAGLKRAQAEAVGKNQIYFDQTTGQQIVVPHGAKPLPQPKGKTPVAQSELDATFNLYETARDGMLSGLRGSATGPFAGRIPAVTSAQQIAAGGVSAMAPVLKQLFRVSGEGVFTDRDQALLLEMVPQRTDNPDAIEAKINNIDAIVKAKLRISPDSSLQSAPRQINTAENIRTAFKSGKITREQAKTQIQQLGGFGAR